MICNVSTPHGKRKCRQCRLGLCEPAAPFDEERSESLIRCLVAEHHQLLLGRIEIPAYDPQKMNAEGRYGVHSLKNRRVLESTELNGLHSRSTIRILLGLSKSKDIVLAIKRSDHLPSIGQRLDNLHRTDLQKIYVFRGITLPNDLTILWGFGGSCSSGKRDQAYDIQRTARSSHTYRAPATHLRRCQTCARIKSRRAIMLTVHANAPPPREQPGGVPAVA